ncbi:CsbD family protein [Pseudomonas helleri]|uniref:CsbD family protein n=1 Tax=Pseudomonas helleri TaxID=1608996 RepID=UPI0028EAF1DE|nr:CsbD family protein [Pseudomonas helleri]
MGKLLGDSKIEAEGAGRQAAGQLTQTYADALDSVSRFAKEKPGASIAIGAVALLVLNRLLRR